MDPNRKYPGFVDILKAIIGSYYIAKENGLDFKIYFSTPFNLTDFLIPANKANNWVLSNKEIHNVSRLNISTGLLNYYGIGNIPELKGKRYQIRNFIGWNILQRNNIEDWEKIWTELYHELFRPSEFLQNKLVRTDIKDNEFIAVHIRFVNALELAEPDYPKRPLCENEKEILIQRCISEIKHIEREEGKSVVVFSDSNMFLERCKEEGLSIITGNVGHITYDNEAETVLKMFVDLYSMSRAARVYSLRSKDLYASAFSLYGSLIGGKQFKVINI